MTDVSEKSTASITRPASTSEMSVNFHQITWHVISEDIFKTQLIVLWFFPENVPDLRTLQTKIISLQKMILLTFLLNYNTMLTSTVENNFLLTYFIKLWTKKTWLQIRRFLANERDFIIFIKIREYFLPQNLRTLLSRLTKLATGYILYSLE